MEPKFHANRLYTRFSARNIGGRGFTLIELLVAIAILAVLAALLFPVFAKTRERARTSGCNSNLKQHGIAFLQYLDDWDGLTPNALTLDTIGSAHQHDLRHLHAKLYAYTRSWDLFRCPSDTGYSTAGQPDTEEYFSLYGTSYQWRSYRTGQENGAEIAVSEVKDPVSFSLERDALAWHQASHGKVSSATWSNPDNASNVLYLDGHVKLVWGTAFAGGI